MKASEIKRNALKCPHSDHFVIQDTILTFKCPKARFKYEYPPGTLAYLGAMAIQECEKCQFRADAPIIPDKVLKHRQIAAHHDGLTGDEDDED